MDDSMSEEHKLLLFPNVEVENKITLLEFLEASTRLAQLVRDLGAIFAPLSYDMTNNIMKIMNGNVDPKASFIDDLLFFEKCNGNDTIATALIWLKRALHFFLVFFQCLLNNPDFSDSENLDPVLAMAYKESLEPFHGWFTRKLFAIFKNACPARSAVIEILKSRLDKSEDFQKQLEKYCQCLHSNIIHIDNFYKLNQLNTNSCVP